MRCASRRRQHGGLAQLGERLHGMQEVTGSIPVFSTNLNTPQKILCGVFFCIYAKISRALCPPGYCLLPALLAAALDCKNGHSPAFSIPLKAKRTHCRLDPAKQCVRFFKKHPRKNRSQLSRRDPLFQEAVYDLFLGLFFI